MSAIDQLSVNTLRFLSAEGVQKANSGHPGLPLGAAPIAYSLYSKILKYNPANPNWIDRDRFILSAGHGSILLYSVLHLFGFDLSIEDLKNFRQFDSKAPGHPEYGHTEGVEITTGPLGQGIANGVGFAMAEVYLADRFNRIGYEVIDHYTYVLAGDGCQMEGISAEAASLAGTLGLGKLIVYYDSNEITIEGSTDIAFTEDVGKRYEAYGWEVFTVEDGNDLNAIEQATIQAKANTDKPSLIIVKTQIGYGVPAKQGKASAHGEPLGEENIKAAKKNLGWQWEESFYVPSEVTEHVENIKKRLSEQEAEWNQLWDKYALNYPELAKELNEWLNGEIPEEILSGEQFWRAPTNPQATRVSSSEVLNRVADVLSNLMGGSADLSPSTKTLINGKGDFLSAKKIGPNLHFGVREHAMAAIANGISAHGGLRPYVATFFVFSDYLKPAARLSALMKLPVIYILTHDSIGVGEDGPTHQPIEHLAGLRSIPNLTVFRPADFKETVAGWYAAITRKTSPTALVLTRQNLPQYSESGKEALKGGYVLLDSGKAPEIILMASGSEVQLVYEAGKKLIEEGISARVVSMPSWELFEEQDEEYKEKVLPRNVTARIAVEAASSQGWHKYTGLSGKIISLDTYGASAPAEILFEKFGFTVNNVLKQAKSLL